MRLLQLLHWTRLGALLLLLSGCGGGVGTGGTGTYSAGPITGFGSIIVNDIRFDDTAASVLDDDDNLRNRSELKLGMTVEVLGDDVAAGAAVAERIRFGSEIVGPVQAIDLAGGSLVVLGQTVNVAVETVFDDRLARGLASLRAGQIVEIYALIDGRTGVYNATRIEPKLLAPEWRLRGIVAARDLAARTLRIGALDVRFDGASGIPATLGVGELVRLRLQNGLDGLGRAQAGSFGLALRPPEDRDDARLRGLVTRLDSTTRFAINGVTVDASAATFPRGTAGLVIGARVEVLGSASGGVLRAASVKVETDDDVRERGFELRGSIASVDAGARTFVLRGLVVSYARPDLRLDDGTLADIVAGRNVEVLAQLSADRTRLEAVRIKFD